MCNHLLPLLFLVVAPLGYFAFRAGLTGSAVVRRAGVVFIVGLVFLNWPADGFSATYLDRVKLLLTAWVIVVMMLRYLRVDWWVNPRNYRPVLTVTAMVAGITYLNFFSFHGSGAFIHAHEVAHYYLGSKYFHELGYGRLYDAMLAAEAEDYEGRVHVARARDLSSNRIVPVVELQPRIVGARARFGEDRWGEFRNDVRYFRETVLGREGYELLLTDHGFNATPAWALLGSTLANLVPGKSDRGVYVLTLIDPLLQIGTFATIGWTFGLETACLAFLLSSVIFGASFDWVGGAYLRYPWFAALMIALCMLRRAHHATSGALLAAASVMRVFPVFFVAGLAAKAFSTLVRDGRIPYEYLRFGVGFSVMGTAMVAVTLVVFGGPERWVEFFGNTVVHTNSLSSNFVGVTNLIAYSLGADVMDPHQLGTLYEWRSWVYRLQIITLLPLAGCFVWLVVRRVDDLSAAALGILLVVTATNIAGYYYTFLVALILAHRQRPEHLAMIFSIEFATHTIRLFEEHLVMLFLYRGLLVAYLMVALYFDELQLELRRVASGSNRAIRSAA